MPGKYQTTRNLFAFVPSSKKESSPETTSNLDQMRSAVASSEDADAHLTGMTRSLNRRLLALNLQPSPLGYMKVA